MKKMLTADFTVNLLRNQSARQNFNMRRATAESAVCIIRSWALIAFIQRAAGLPSLYVYCCKNKGEMLGQQEKCWLLGRAPVVPKLQHQPVSWTLPVCSQLPAVPGFHIRYSDLVCKVSNQIRIKILIFYLAY
jgi:hypothetical protein